MGIQESYRTMLEKLQDRLLSSVVTLRNEKNNLKISKEEFLTSKSKSYNLVYYRHLYLYLLYIHSSRDISFENIREISKLSFSRNLVFHSVKKIKNLVEIQYTETIKDLIAIKTIYTMNYGISKLQMDCELLWGRCYGTFLEEQNPDFYYALKELET